MLTRMRWEMPADAENVSLCRQGVRLLLEHNRISERDVDEVELIVGELCSNVIRHAYDTRSGCLALELALDGTVLEVSVRDAGRGFDASELPAQPVFTEHGGMGLFLTREYMDRFQIGHKLPSGSAITASRTLARRGEAGGRPTLRHVAGAA